MSILIIIIDRNNCEWFWIYIIMNNYELVTQSMVNIKFTSASAASSRTHHAPWSPSQISTTADWNLFETQDQPRAGWKQKYYQSMTLCAAHAYLVIWWLHLDAQHFQGKNLGLVANLAGPVILGNNGLFHSNIATYKNLHHMQTWNKTCESRSATHCIHIRAYLWLSKYVVSSCKPTAFIKRQKIYAHGKSLWQAHFDLETLATIPWISLTYHPPTMLFHRHSNRNCWSVWLAEFNLPALAPCDGLWWLEQTPGGLPNILTAWAAACYGMKSTCRGKNVTSSHANLQVHRHGTKGQGYIMLHCDEFHNLQSLALSCPLPAKCCADSMHFNIGQSSFWRVYQRPDVFKCHGPPQKCTCQRKGSKGNEKCGLGRGMERVVTRIP